jgi:hypothetical protein
MEIGLTLAIETKEPQSAKAIFEIFDSRGSAKPAKGLSSKIYQELNKANSAWSFFDSVQHCKLDENTVQINLIAGTGGDDYLLEIIRILSKVDVVYIDGRAVCDEWEDELGNTVEIRHYLNDEGIIESETYTALQKAPLLEHVGNALINEENKNDYKAALNLIKKGEGINECDSQASTPLKITVTYPNSRGLVLFRELLRHGADPNYPEPWYSAFSTLLSYWPYDYENDEAIAVEMLKELLSAGANPNIVYEQKSSGEYKLLDVESANPDAYFLFDLLLSNSSPTPIEIIAPYLDSDVVRLVLQKPEDAISAEVRSVLEARLKSAKL